MPTLLTVYHDGSCPLCRLEIAHYRSLRGADRIAWADISDALAYPGVGLSRSGAMARFHVRTAAGDLLSGAAAFVAVWDLLAGWRWAARACRAPGVLAALEFGYIVYLPVRPLLAGLVGCFSRY